MWKIVIGLVIALSLSGALLWAAAQELGALKGDLQRAVAAMGEVQEGIETMQRLSREDAERQTKRFDNMRGQLQEIANYASDNSIDRVSLNANWVWLHDVQALGIDPNSTTGRDLQGSARVANDIETLTVVGGNYGLCQELRDQAQLCRDWAANEVERFKNHGK